MADALDSKSSALQRRVGSTPTSGTTVVPMLYAHTLIAFPAEENYACYVLCYVIRVALASARPYNPL